jgi:hypothetical protein
MFVIHWLNFMSNPFILIYSGGGGIKFMKHFKGGASTESLEMSDT